MLATQLWTLRQGQSKATQRELLDSLSPYLHFDKQSWYNQHMIQSLFHKKNIDLTQEDPTTSTIIGTLLHLPDQQLWQVLREACYVNSVLPEDPGILKAYEFWPRWNSAGTTNVNYVEPDVFLRFSTVDLILEAKRFDESGQNRAEWKRELIAYKNEYGAEGKPVFLIALGGNGSNMQNEVVRVNGQARTIIKCSWVKLYDACLERHKTLSANSKRVLDSVIIACNQLGIRRYRWLDEKPWLAEYIIITPKNYHGLFHRRITNG